MLVRLQTNAAAVALRPGAMEHGTVRVQGNRTTTNNAVPSVVLAAEHYNMLVRMLQAGVQVQLRIEVGARFDETDRSSQRCSDAAAFDDHIVFEPANQPGARRVLNDHKAQALMCGRWRGRSFRFGRP